MLQHLGALYFMKLAISWLNKFILFHTNVTSQQKVFTLMLTKWVYIERFFIRMQQMQEKRQQCLNFNTNTCVREHLWAGPFWNLDVGTKQSYV